MEKKTLDDGNWLWHYECEYIPPWDNPKNWYYTIVFETEKGGYLSGEEIICRYFNTENILQISHAGSKISFFAENFNDIENIIKPMIKGTEGAKVYPIYESIRSIRKDKINNINKNDNKKR